MITDTFDNITEEIIKVYRNEDAKKVDVCILTFSHVILKYVLENYSPIILGCGSNVLINDEIEYET